MTTPWCIEFKEDIILVFNDHILVIVGDNNLDRALLLLGNRLRLDAGLNLAIDEVLDELADFIMCDLLVLAVGELGILNGVLNGEGGPFPFFKIQISSVCAKSFSVYCCEVDGSLVLLREGLKGF